MPEVTITDSEGRPLVVSVVSPRQADLVSRQMADIGGWLADGVED